MKHCLIHQHYTGVRGQQKPKQPQRTSVPTYKSIRETVGFKKKEEEEEEKKKKKKDKRQKTKLGAQTNLCPYN